MPLSVAVWRATLRPGRKSSSNTIGASTTSATGFPAQPEDAADLTQEVFIKMYRTLNTYDGSRASFMTWVTTVTRNLLVDHFRKGKYDRVTDSLDAAPGGQEEGLTWPRSWRIPPPAPRRWYGASRHKSWSMRLWPSCRRSCGRRSFCGICKTWTTRILP